MLETSRRALLPALSLVLVTSAACRSPLPAATPAGVAPPREPLSVAVTSSTTAPRAVQPRPAKPEPEPEESGELGRLRLQVVQRAAPGSSGLQGTSLGGVDWTSVANMNHGTPSMMPLGGAWGMSLSSGMDRLEECEPTLALTRHGPGFTDTFVFLAAHYRLSHSAHLVGSIAGIRAQDEAISDVVDDADVSAFTLGVALHF